MKKLSINRPALISGVFMLLVGLLIGWWLKPASPSGHEAEMHQHEAGEDPGASTWTCSMHPQIRQGEPGKCPICGMDLIPLENETMEEEPLAIRMSPTAMQLASVQTAVVGRGEARREIRVNGKVQPDERRVFSQVTHLEGRVEDLKVDFTGEPVRKGQSLASIYSPELVTAQEELFAAAKIKDLQPALFNAAREKLQNWKLSESQIDQILASGKPRGHFPILADVSGIVLEKRVNLGDYLMRGMPLYDIADLSKVWVLFDLYESDMAWVKVGSTVEFTVPSYPGERFSGRVAFIDPVINPATRVASARVEMANPGGRLKPEMFVSGVITSQLPGKNARLLIPKSAVLWTGERSVVYVKSRSEQGIHFQMREITLGPQVGDQYVVESGLEPGEEIAVSGTFSIDAAAQLAGKPSMMNPKGGAVATGHQHTAEAPAKAPASQSAPAQSPEAQAAIRKLLDLYFPLKDALVNSDLPAAKKQAAALKSAFEKTSMSLFTGEAHDHWMAHSSAARKALNQMAAARELEAARKPFQPLSDQMVALAQRFASSGDPLYVQHCPMAFNNQGADWLSQAREIRNPYFGDEMLTCGSVKETIGKKQQ